MKRFYFFLFVVLSVVGVNAQNTPPTHFIEATVSKLDTVYTFNVGCAEAGSVISVDWGDGKIVTAGTSEQAYDGWYGDVEVSGTATGTVRIYSTGTVTHFSCVNKSALGAAGLTSLDISNAKDLTELEANGNYLTEFDFSQNKSLAKVYLNNNCLTSVSLNTAVTYLNLQNNRLTAFDGSIAPMLSTIYLSDNTALGNLDLSKNTSLKSVYAINAGITSLKLGANATKSLYVSVNDNPGLTSLDVTEATGLGNKGRLFATNCNLTELKYSSIATANVSNNKFTLSSLPTANITNLTYAPQKDMEIEDISGVIDLSSQAFVGDKATVYTWYAASGNDAQSLSEGTDYKVDGGKFTFLKDFDAVYCAMSNGALPKFSGNDIFKTVTVRATASSTTGIFGIEDVDAKAPVFTINGVSAGNYGKLPAGIYVRNGKKFVVK